MFDKQPHLEGLTLSLRPLTQADFADLFAVASDPALWALHPAKDRYQEPVFRKLFAESLASGGALVVIDKAAGTIIGSSRYQLAEPMDDRVEIGWSYLARSHWGGAANAELKSLMLAHAFRFVGKVRFRVGEGNLRSRRAMEKIGGRLTQDTEASTLPDGTPVVHVIYEIARDDFMRVRRRLAPSC